MSADAEICFRPVLLLEAAECHGNANPATPPCRTKRDIATSSPASPPARPTKPAKFGAASSSVPPAKRVKLDFGRIRDGVRPRSDPRSSPSVIRIRSIDGSRKCSGGNAHRTWERTDECADAAVTSSRGFEFFNAQDGVTAGSGEVYETLELCNKDGNGCVKLARNIAHRNVWKGFIAGARQEDHSRLNTSKGTPCRNKQQWGPSTLSRGSSCKGEKGATFPLKK